MKTFLLLTIILITTSMFVQGTPCLERIKISFTPKIPVENSIQKDSIGDEKKSQPDNVLVINIDQLRAHTKDISLLKPVFMIVSALENVTEKLHGRKLKITCNKSSDKRD